MESPLEWPGIQCARELVHGEKLEGFWWARSKEWAARRRGQDVATYDFATRYLVDLAQLPAFRDLSPEEYQDRVADLVREIEEEGREARGGDTVAGVVRILSQNPSEVPTRKTKRSPRPTFHAKQRAVYRELWDEFQTFLDRYWTAVESLRGEGGRVSAEGFPCGCYPPSLCFTGAPAPPRPPAPPTRSLTVVASKVVERGVIPTIELPPVRGQPP